MSLARLLSALVASLLLVASAVALDRADTGDPVAADEPPSASDREDGDTSDAPDDGSPSPSAQPSPSMDTEAAVALLTSVDAAVAAGAEEVLAAGLAVAQGEWRTFGDPEWPVRHERPVYVVEAQLGADAERVDAFVAIAFRQQEDADDLVLRSLAASSILEANGAGYEARVEVNGEEVPVEVDGEGARLIIDVDLRAGEAYLVRIVHRYELVPGAALSGNGGPAGFGLLARHERDRGPLTANLGHWLPLLTFDGGPMVEWGDVGAFPAAIWSVLVDHQGTLVTGGEEGDCPAGRDVTATCTWSRGISLRDVSGVWFADPPTVDTGQSGRLTVNAVVPQGTFSRSVNEQALAESIDGVEVFTAALGSLAWREFDVVAGELLEGAAGMEFPGLVIIDLDVYGALGGRFGTYVIAHEVAHQWFHALVGNSSLDSPVVDEALSQYLSVVYYAELFGEAAAEALADSSLRDRYLGARQRGLVDEPPAQPLEDFAGDGAYSPLVYARAPLAWLEAEDVIGRDRVVAFLAALVDRYGLGHVTDDDLLDDATAFDPELGEIVQRYWFDPAPLGSRTG